MSIDALSRFVVDSSDWNEVIKVNMDLVKIAGSLKAGILLGYLLEQEPDNNGEWIIRSDKELGEILYLTRHTTQSTRRTLKEKGFVSTKTILSDGAPVTHYKLHPKRIADALGIKLDGEYQDDPDQPAKYTKRALGADVLYRQEGRCYICGIEEWRIKKRLALHRILPGKDGGQYEPDNVMGVCPKCHSRIEGMTAEQIEEVRRG